MIMRITIKVMICQEDLRQIVFFLHFSRLKLIKLQRSQGSLPQAIEIWQRERETARKLQFSSLEGNHCKVFCAKQHPPSPSNHCFFHVHVLCPSSHWPFLPPPWQQPLFTSRAGPTSIPLFINLHSPCPTLVIRLSFLWMFQFCRYDKMRKSKMWRKKCPMCEILQLNCPPHWHHIDCNLCQVWREGCPVPNSPTHSC